MIRRIVLLSGTVLAIVGSSLNADEKESAGKIPENLRKSLDAEGLVITDSRLRQGFSAYIRNEYSGFLTSDSLLMAYSCLLEKVMAEKQLNHLAAHAEWIVEMGKHMPAVDDPSKGVPSQEM